MTLTWTDPNNPLKIFTGPHHKDISAEQSQYIDMTLPDGGVKRLLFTNLNQYNNHNCTYTITGLEYDASYTFSAGAWTKEADSGSPWVQVARIKTSNQVTSLAAAAATIHLTWTQPTSDSQVSLERSDDGGEIFEPVPGTITGTAGNTVSFDDTALDAGTYYYFLVAASDPTVPISNLAEATTWGSPLPQPGPDGPPPVYPPGVPGPSLLPPSGPDPTPTLPPPTRVAIEQRAGVVSGDAGNDGHRRWRR